MSTKHYCDRCGNPKAMMLVEIEDRALWDCPKPHGRYDLCRGCFKDFRRFMKVGEKLDTTNCQVVNS